MVHSATSPDVEAGAAGWPRYRLYGMTIATEFSFANRLTSGAAPPDLSFSCASAAPLSLEGREPLYVHPAANSDGDSYAVIHRMDDCHVVRYGKVMEFYVWPRKIICRLLDPASEYLVEIRLLGDILALWLELSGVLALHASCVAIDGLGVAFASWNKGGKTSLAASLMQAGYPMLTDDILAVDPRPDRSIASAGYPQMRMWPEEAHHFLGRVEDLEIVHPLYAKRRIPVGPGGIGGFRPEPARLACIYVLERDQAAEDEIEITALDPTESMLQLLRHSFARELVEAVKLQPRRLPALARLVGQVPVRHVRHSVPRTHLPKLRRAVLDDLAGLHV